MGDFLIYRGVLFGPEIGVLQRHLMSHLHQHIRTLPLTSYDPGGGLFSFMTLKQLP